MDQDEWTFDRSGVREASLLGEYLTARRTVLQPEDVGLRRDPNRRVGGLRRREVAAIAGISTDYYLRLEQGRDRQPSDQVIGALARALQVGEFGDRHMRRLVRLQHHGRVRPRRTVVDATAQSLLEFWPLTPVAVIDSNLDVISSNGIASALDEELLVPGANLLLGIFDREDAGSAGWFDVAAHAVAALRFRCDPYDLRLQEIVGRLSIRQPVFRELWARHDSRPWTDGLVHFSARGFGRVPFRFHTLDIPSIEGCSVSVFHAADRSAKATLAYLATLESDGFSLPASVSA